MTSLSKYLSTKYISYRLIPNFLSSLRIPLALCFLSSSTELRVFAIVCSMLTDVADGYLARRYNSTSSFGAILDPLTDKFFVLFTLSILFFESQIGYFELLAFFARDLSLIFFTGYLLLTKRWSSYKISAFILGKMVTALQFFVLVAIVCHIEVPESLFFLLATLGFASFFELYIKLKK